MAKYVQRHEFVIRLDGVKYTAREAKYIAAVIGPLTYKQVRSALKARRLGQIVDLR